MRKEIISLLIIIISLSFLFCTKPNLVHAQLQLLCGDIDQPCCWVQDTPSSYYCPKNGIPDNPNSASCRCRTVAPSPSVSPIKPLFCGGGESGIETAIGCIPTKPEVLVAVLLPWVMGLGGGIAFLFMLYAAFLILTSSGDPEKLKNGQEMLTSAIIGLLFVIFSTFLLRIIGIPIMEISK